MRIALPTTDGRLCMHFGHCERFVLVDVDLEKREAIATREAVPPPHEPGVLPRWLAEQGAGVIIAGGMGRRAQDLFAASGIEVVLGAPDRPTDDVIADWLAGSLRVGSNPCDH